jgi:restriction endonuclease Mrr
VVVTRDSTEGRQFGRSGRGGVARTANCTVVNTQETEFDLSNHHFDLSTCTLLTTLLSDAQLSHSIDWRTFEKVLARALEEMGYEIELRRGTKDGGIDIIALRHDSQFGRHRYLVQAKRTKQRVGVEPVRELPFLQQHVGATKACLVTTSTFTKGAWQLA